MIVLIGLSLNLQGALLITCLNQKNIVRKRQASPKYNIYTELLFGSSKLFIVLDAPMTKRNKETAMKIGNLL